MKILTSVNTSSAQGRAFGRSILRLEPRAIAMKALFVGIVLFNLLGAIMGLGDFVVAYWNRHPFLTIASIVAAILLFAALIEFGIASLQTGPAQRT